MNNPDNMLTEEDICNDHKYEVHENNNTIGAD